MRKAARAIVLMAAMLTGCGDQRILEELGFTQTTSYDLLPDGRLDVTNSIPLADPQAKGQRETIRVASDSSKESRIQMARQTSLKLVSGQLRNAIFGLTLSRSGLWDHIDTLIRDPSISPQVKVTVINGNAGELLRKNYKQHPRTGKYIDKLLRKEAAGQSVPKITLYQFARDYYDDGIDPVAPILKDVGEHIAVDGIALFRDDRYVAKIKPDDAMIFALLRGKFKQGELSLNLTPGRGSDKELVMFSSMVGSRKVKAKRKGDQTTVTFKVRVSGSVLEYIGPRKLSDDKQRKQLEQEMSAYLANKCEEVMALMQRNKADSVGIGMYVRDTMTYKEWKSLRWNEDVYPTIRVNFKVTVKIKDYGKFR